jgi:glucokinase
VSSNHYSIGVDLGGTGVKCAAIDLTTREILHQDTRPTDDGKLIDGQPAFVVAIQSLVQATEAAIGRPAAGVGVSAPGLASKDETHIAFMEGRLAGLAYLNWGNMLGRPGTVPVLNDAQAALLGEVWMGAAKDLKNVFMLTLGTGVGGAAMVDGHLLRGHVGRAGHLGHITVDYTGPGDIVKTPGSLEDAVGNATIQQRSNGQFETTLDLIKAVEQGDARAKTIWNESLKALAAGIASLVNVLDPEAVIIGGGISVAGATLFDPLAVYLDEFEWRPMGQAAKLLPAKLGPWAGCYGMAYRARI